MQLSDDRKSFSVGSQDVIPMEGLTLLNRSDRIYTLSWGPANTFVLNLKTHTLHWTQSDGATGTGVCQ